MFVGAIFSNDVWTFWDVMLLFFVWIPLMMVWFFCLFDVFGRHDLSGWGKAAWLLGIIIVPWIGAICYLIFRPSDQDQQYATPSYSYDGRAAGTGTATPIGEPKDRVPTA